MRQALTVATTGGHGYMKQCRDNMRSELPKYDGLIVEILSSSIIHAWPHDIAVIRNVNKSTVLLLSIFVLWTSFIASYNKKYYNDIGNDENKGVLFYVKRI